MPYGKSDQDGLNETCVLSEQLSRGSWKNLGFVWYWDNNFDNKVSATEIFHQPVVKWLTKEFLFAKSNSWSIEKKTIKEFTKWYYRPENRANVLALKVVK